MQIAVRRPVVGRVPAISPPGDQREQEADGTADRAMRMTAQHRDRSLGPGAPVHTPANTRGVLPAVDAALRSAGRPLEPATRAFFEPRLDHDLSGIRIHTDACAADSARAISARAYAWGAHVVFARGEYQPDTNSGRRLLAHELAHTLEPGAGAEPAIRRKMAVGAGLTLDTMGYTTSRTGDVYTCPKVVKNTIWHELFTSLMHSPRVFTLDGTTNKQVDANFKKHMSARHDILEFAAKKAYTFAAGAASRMNPLYWDVNATSWSLKSGADADKAIADLNVHPGEYAIACLPATKLTMVGGSKSELSDDFGVASDDWIPGDWGYITNTSFQASGEAGLEGENIIYTGKDKFWGHFGPGKTYRTHKEWFDEVASWHGGAAAADYRIRPKVGLR